VTGWSTSRSGRFTPERRIREQRNFKQRQVLRRAVQSNVSDNFRDRRVRVGRLTIYKHSTQDRYHLVTTFRLECDYEEICERDLQTNTNGFLFQQHRPIFLLNPDSYLSTPRDYRQVNTRNHPFTLLCLFMWMGLPTSSLVDQISFFYRQECVPALTLKYVHR